jgi:hypothetical protein
MAIPDIVNRAARKTRNAAAKASLNAGNMSTTVLQSLGSSQSTVAAFQAAYPSGSAPMSTSLLSSFKISQTGLAGKFMSAANLKSYAAERVSQLKSLGDQVGKDRLMTYSAMKGQLLSKAQTAKNNISSSFMSKIAG